MRIATILAVALLGTSSLAGAEHAQAAIQHYKLNIPRQSLDMALKDLAQQTGLQIGRFSGRIDGSAMVGPVLGDQTPEQALKTLLYNTGLNYKIVSDTTIAVYNPKDPTPSTTGLSGSGSSFRVPGEATRSLGEGGPLQLAQSDSSSQLSPPSSVSATTLAQSQVQTGPEVNHPQEAKIEEIIVTAQKRTERLQDVPVPVTVLNTDNLAENNLFRIQDYYNDVPGLTVTRGDFRGDPQITIRGVTTGGAVTNPTVGIVIDDVPYGASTGLAGGGAAPDLDPSDLVRIEVLRGPQGTLYGASTIGGLLKYMTVDPSTEALSGRVQMGISSVYNGAEPGYNMRAAVNVPLSDTFAMRASVFTREDPGYIYDVETGKHGTNESDVDGGRLSTLWRPSGTFSLKLSALFQDTRVYGSADVQPGLGNLSQNVISGAGGWNKNSQAYSAIASAKLGAFDLTSLTGYSVNKIHDSVDETGGYGPLTQAQFGVTGTQLLEDLKTTKYSQELRLSASIGQRLDWLLGAFYTHESTPYVEQIIATNNSTGALAGIWQPYDSFPTTYEEYAAFTDLTVHLTDRFNIQLGGRESQNSQSYQEAIAGIIAPVLYGLPSPIVNPKEVTRDNSFTYLLTPSFKVSPDLMVYARLASGYRPGGPNPTATLYGLPEKFNPDKTNNYEIGAKGDVLDNELSFDASAYYIDWKDIQIQLFEPSSGATYYFNASRAKSQGVEFSVESRPVTGLTIAAWVAWNNAVLTQGFPADSTVYGVAGDRLPYGSRYSGTFSLNEEFSLGRDVMGHIGGSASYVGDRVGAFTGTPMREDLPAYVKTDLRAGVKYESWLANLFVNNVADKRGVLSVPQVTFTAFDNTYIEPRTVGLSISKTF